MARAGASELVLHVAHGRVAVAEDEGGEQGAVEVARRVEAGGEQAADGLAQSGDRAGRRVVDDVDLPRPLDADARQHALLAVVVGEVELAGVHRRRGPLEHPEHAHRLPGGEARVGPRDLHERLAGRGLPAVPRLDADDAGDRHLPRRHRRAGVEGAGDQARVVVEAKLELREPARLAREGGDVVRRERVASDLPGGDPADRDGEGDEARRDRRPAPEHARQHDRRRERRDPRPRRERDGVVRRNARDQQRRDGDEGAARDPLAGGRRARTGVHERGLYRVSRAQGSTIRAVAVNGGPCGVRDCPFPPPPPGEGQTRSVRVREIVRSRSLPTHAKANRVNRRSPSPWRSTACPSAGGGG